jgi:hypothetical protein
MNFVTSLNAVFRYRMIFPTRLTDKSAGAKAKSYVQELEEHE